MGGGITFLFLLRRRGFEFRGERREVVLCLGFRGFRFV